MKTLESEIAQLGAFLNSFLSIAAGTIIGQRVMSFRADNSPESAVRFKQIKFQSDDDLTADLCLGVAIAGVNTLIGIALIIVFA